MTNILEYQKSRNQKMQKKEMSEAEKLFLDNIGHIEKIKTTKWYKMIRNYWVNEWNSSLKLLSWIDINDTANLAKLKAKLELATTFISYLDAHEKGLT